MTSQPERPIHQPIHPNARPRLDPEYVAFHEEHLQYCVPYEDQPWDPRSRVVPSPMALGGAPPVEVGLMSDLDRGAYQFRIFTPDGSMPRKGWPVVVWFHGGMSDACDAGCAGCSAAEGSGH